MAEFDLLITRFDELDKRVEARFQALNSRFDDVNLALYQHSCHQPQSNPFTVSRGALEPR
jgi:hypothetical protein